jgi:hypothetical protein
LWCKIIWLDPSESTSEASQLHVDRSNIYVGANHTVWKSVLRWVFYIILFE